MVFVDDTIFDFFQVTLHYGNANCFSLKVKLQGVVFSSLNL